MRLHRPSAIWLVLLPLLILPDPARAQAPAAADPARPSPSPAPADAPALPPAGGPGGGDRPGAAPFVDLVHRYRFSEQYTAREVAPGLIGPYRVTARETFREGIGGSTKGAPERVRQVEYSERPAEVSGLGIVTS